MIIYVFTFQLSTMKRTVLLFFTFYFSLFTFSQSPVEGLNYYLPKTVLKFTLQIEQTTFTAGDLALYSDRYLKKPVRNTNETTYRILDVKMQTVGEVDTTKQYTVTIDKKHTIISLQRENNGLLTHVNYHVLPIADLIPKPYLSIKPAKLNPRDYFTEEMLAAGSNAKLAELVAKEIYAIRESRNQLERGEAEFMPKDGEQLKTMLARLDKQEKALLQLFDGEETSQTFEKTISYTPQPDKPEDVAFRFSTRLGLTSADDLAGEPYYIKVEDLKQLKPLPSPDTQHPSSNKAKDDIGLIVNIPGKIKITLSSPKETLFEQELYAAQFGQTENLSGNLFKGKMLTRVKLDTVTGSVIAIDVQPIE